MSASPKNIPKPETNNHVCVIMDNTHIHIRYRVTLRTTAHLPQNKPIPWYYYP